MRTAYLLDAHMLRHFVTEAPESEGMTRLRDMLMEPQRAAPTDATGVPKKPVVIMDHHLSTLELLHYAIALPLEVFENDPPRGSMSQIHYDMPSGQNLGYYWVHVRNGQAATCHFNIYVYGKEFFTHYGDVAIESICQGLSLESTNGTYHSESLVIMLEQGLLVPSEEFSGTPLRFDQIKLIDLEREMPFERAVYTIPTPQK